MLCQLSLSLILGKTFHVYDGFVFPGEKWWSYIAQFIKITGIDTKNAWGCALTAFLNKLKVLHTEPEEFNISRQCDLIYQIYFHIKQKRFVPYSGGNRPVHLSDIEQLNNRLQKVRVWMVSQQCYEYYVN